MTGNHSLASAGTLPEGGKARRVYLHLHEEITRGFHGVGEALPGEQKLSAALGVSRVTVRRALDALEREGLIERKAGSGTIVCSPDVQPAMAFDFNTLMPQLVEMSRNTTARLLSFNYGTAPGNVASAMGLEPDAPVQFAVRLRLSEGVPFSHLTTWVPEEIAAGYTEAELATTPLFSLLERSGVKVASADQTVNATLASPDVAKALGSVSARPCCRWTGLSGMLTDEGLNICPRSTGLICSGWKCRSAALARAMAATGSRSSIPRAGKQQNDRAADPAGQTLVRA